MIGDAIKQAVDAAQAARPDLKARLLDSGAYALLANHRPLARVGVLLRDTVWIESAGGMFQMVPGDRAAPAVLAALLLHAVEDSERALSG